MKIIKYGYFTKPNLFIIITVINLLIILLNVTVRGRIGGVPPLILPRAAARVYIQGHDLTARSFSFPATWCSGYALRLLLLWEKKKGGLNPFITKAVLPPAPLFPAGNKSGLFFGTYFSGFTEITPFFRPYWTGVIYKLIFLNKPDFPAFPAGVINRNFVNYY